MVAVVGVVVAVVGVVVAVVVAVVAVVELLARATPRSEVTTNKLFIGG